jgi:hypothetical protein
MDTYPAKVAILESEMLIYIRVKGEKWRIRYGGSERECLPTFNGIYRRYYDVLINGIKCWIDLGFWKRG